MTPTLIIVPGLGDSGPEHWQTLWAQKYGAARVQQDDPEAPTADGWAARLQEVIADTPGELVLVGHSAGVLTIVHWAALGEVPERVKGALLVAPTDVAQPGMAEREPALVAGMAPVPMQPLPFPALVIASEDDPLVTFARAEEMAAAWDAEIVSAGAVGHIYDVGDWPDGQVLLSEALHAWTPPEISRF